MSDDPGEVRETFVIPPDAGGTDDITLTFGAGVPIELGPLPGAEVTEIRSDGGTTFTLHPVTREEAAAQRAAEAREEAAAQRAAEARPGLSGTPWYPADRTGDPVIVGQASVAGDGASLLVSGGLAVGEGRRGGNATIQCGAGAGGGDDGDILLLGPEKTTTATAKILGKIPAYWSKPTFFEDAVNLAPATTKLLSATVSVHDNGDVMFGEPLGAEAVASTPAGSLDRFLVGIASAVARLHWEVERIKERVT